MVSKSFTNRMIFGGGITLLAFLLINFSNLPFLWVPFLAIIALIITFCLSEYCTIFQALDIDANKSLLIGLSLFYLLCISVIPDPVLSLFFIFLALVVGFFVLMWRSKMSITDMAATMLGWVWITFPLATAFQINYFFSPNFPEQGRYWLLYVLFVSKMCDMTAYFIGSKFGKTPMAPAISPNKTIEGAIWGIVGAVITSYIFYNLSIISIGRWESLFLGVVIAILAGIGDLAESILKRNAGFKDSNQLPGLGGVFDIMDSLLFTFPFIYFYLLFKWPGL